MENLIVEEICKNLKWYERILIKLFKHTFYKVYKEGARAGFNFSN